MTHWARARSTHNQILLGKGRKRKREGEGVKRRTSLSPFLVHDAMTAFATADGLAWFNLVFGATIWKNGGCGIFFFQSRFEGSWRRMCNERYRVCASGVHA